VSYHIIFFTFTLAATHCPNERILDPQSAARQTHLCRTMAFTPQCSPATTHYGSEYYQLLTVTHLPSLEG